MKLIATLLAVCCAVLVADKATADHNREPQPNECRVTREGARPGHDDEGEFVECQYWQTFRCEDGYEFTQVWGESTIRNTFGNALREDES